MKHILLCSFISKKFLRHGWLQYFIMLHRKGKERIFMGNKIIIEDNTIYEIDEECIKRMEKQKIVMEERKNRVRTNTSNRNKNCKN